VQALVALNLDANKQSSMHAETAWAMLQRSTRQAVRV